jgi:hypothetical protein
MCLFFYLTRSFDSSVLNSTVPRYVVIRVDLVYTVASVSRDPFQWAVCNLPHRCHVSLILFTSLRKTFCNLRYERDLCSRRPIGASIELGDQLYGCMSFFLLPCASIFDFCLQIKLVRDALQVDRPFRGLLCTRAVDPESRRSVSDCNDDVRCSLSGSEIERSNQALGQIDTETASLEDFSKKDFYSVC